MADPTPFTFPNGIRGTVDDDGKISILGKAAREDQRPSALSGPGASDPDGPSPLAVPQGKTVPSVDSGSQPLSSLRPPEEAPLEKEDPIGDTLVSASVGAPARDVAGAVLGKVVPRVAEAGGAVGRAIGKVVQPSLKHAAVGAAEAAAPALLHTGDPLHAGKAAIGGAVVGGLIGQSAHGALKKIIKTALAEKAEAAGGEAADAALAGHVIDGNHVNPSVTEHLTTLAGSAGPPGVEALKAVALRPTLETLQAAVKAGVPAYIALQVARLGHSGVVAP